jgi:ribosome-associated protein
MTKPKKASRSEELAGLIIEGIQEKKGLQIVKIDLRKIGNSISDFFVICHATSNRQVDAIAESVESVVKNQLGDRPNSVEGLQNAEWVLMDYVDVVVHVFQEKFRALYALEDLWADAPMEEIKES